MLLINPYYFNLFDSLRLILQVLTAVISVFYTIRLKKTIWIWFIIYLCIIVFFEVLFKFKDQLFTIHKSIYYEIFLVPLQFLFFFWLYTIKSKNLFYIFSSIFVISLFLDLFVFENFNKPIFSFSYCVGTFLLFILINKEFLSYFKNDNILYFKSNKMFYINSGNFFFYVGSLPLMIFYNFIKSDYPNFHSIYFYFFQLSNCVLYLFYIASFLWGKPKIY